jgi:hypothetical protein
MAKQINIEGMYAFPTEYSSIHFRVTTSRAKPAGGE